MSMKILLIGASGRTGRALADLLLKQQDFEVTALVRRPDFALPGAKVVVADLTGDFSSAFNGITHAIYAAGSAESEGATEEEQIDRDAVARAADYAKARNVQKLVVISSLSAYWPQSSPEFLRHYSQMKREGDERVIASGIDYVILRPGPLTDDPGVGKIALTEERLDDAPPVARQDVAWAAIEAIKLGISKKTIGFVGGSVPIEQALRAEARPRRPTGRAAGRCGASRAAPARRAGSPRRSATRPDRPGPPAGRPDSSRPHAACTRRGASPHTRHRGAAPADI